MAVYGCGTIDRVAVLDTKTLEIHSSEPENTHYLAE